VRARRVSTSHGSQGVAGVATPVLLKKSIRLDLMRVEAVLKASTISLGPKATGGQILGYNNVRSVFDGSWLVRR
jgi:hypothetical protein